MLSNLSIRQAVGLAVGTAGAAAASLGYMPLAQAADAAGPTAAAAPDASLDEVIVTGSRIRRVDAETASPIMVIDNKIIEESGLQTVGDLIQRIPSVSGNATNPAANNGGGFGESGIELRGLSDKRTLVLVDGRRIGLVGQTDQATDVNQIPIALIERVEVLKEGAGAVYGSDAIAGVVNFITRKDVDGLELSGDYGRTTKNDGAHHSVNALFGTSTDKFNIIVGGGIMQQDAISAGNRQFSKYALYLYGGSVSKRGSSRVPTGRIFTNPLGLTDASGAACGSLTRIAGASGSALTDYRCYNPQADAYNYQPLNLIETPVERASVFSKVNYKINDYVEAYAAVTGNHTHSGYQIAPLPFDAQADNVVLSGNSIYNPFAMDLGGNSGANPNFTERFTALGDRRGDASTDSAIVNGGVKGKVFDTGWNWDANLSYSRMDQHQSISGYFFSNLLQNAVGPSYYADPTTGAVVAAGTPGAVPTCGSGPTTAISGCIPVDLFNPNSPSQIAALKTISTGYNTENVYIYKAATLDFNGKILDLPAGALQAAVGFEYDEQHDEFTADAIVQAVPPTYLTCQISQEACSGNSAGGYNSKQEYLELFVPILKDLPGVHALNVDVGVRHSDYSLFGGDTKSDFKVEYRPVQDLMIRGTFSQVFRVPTVHDLFGAPQIDSPTFNDPCAGLTAAQLAANKNYALACQGVVPNTGFAEPNGQVTGSKQSSTNLKPETGTVKTVGFVFDPHWIENLSFDVDYWKYHIDGLITQLDPNYTAQQCIATGNPTFCNLIQRYVGGASPGQVIEIVEPTVNLGSLDTDGVDVTVKYALRNLPIGSFQFSLDWTHLLTYKNDPAPGAAIQEVAGSYNRQFGNYAKNRALLQIDWNWQGADVLLTGRYIDKILLFDPSGGPATPANYPALQIPSYIYIDATAGYTFPTKTKVQVGIMNLADKQPPVLFQNNVVNGNTDVETYDTIGRRWFVGFTQKF
jgi:iron complex outermembrane receptor protein